ncbi:PAAR domain-containing protein [Citrobacter sp. JGM124]|uniref:PAAR domain-containing protein n=1 Tax=Citrobacter sp. JGM124 TaxID=2799789 RepID=UPI001BA9929E|nr:PAAR domain-containing protein [Citrobacter sp. JGM124]MBS0849867.1 PAAR domain-containing protein [Citrobacter sp. JGM124]
MATGFWVVKGDKTTCGGSVLSGHPKGKMIGPNNNRQATVGCQVSCGQHPGIYSVAGGYPGEIIHGQLAASTIYSRSTCPCKAFFIPTHTFMSHGPYQAPQRASAPVEPEQHAQAAKKSSLPPYLTGEKTESGFVPDYPVLRNTQDFPDENLRGMLSRNNHDVMLLTIPEAFEVLQSWGWNDTKTAWVETTQSGVGQVLVNYGVNGKDVVTTSMIISKLGSFGIKATVYINHKGTELIKLTGYPGIRKILNAPVFALKNPKVVDLGIGKYGLGKSIIEGARLTFYVAAAYRTLDFILNDENHLAQFIGSLATDVVKIGIASAISWGVGTISLALVSTISSPLIVVVVAGVIAAIGLNYLDDKFGVTDKLISCIEQSQQEFVEKARAMEKGLWDLGEMYADDMLKRGVKVIESEVRRYIRSVLGDINMRFL